MASGAAQPYVVTNARPSAAADRSRRTRRYVTAQAVRLCCFVAAALLPVPMPARLALIAASIVLPWGAVIAANAGPMRSRQRVDVVLAAEPPPSAGAAPTARLGPTSAGGSDRGPARESSWYRLRWWLSYALLQVYGPAQLSGDDDPRQKMLAARARHRTGVVAGGSRGSGGAPPLPPGPDGAFGARPT